MSGSFLCHTIRNSHHFDRIFARLVSYNQVEIIRVRIEIQDSLRTSAKFFKVRRWPLLLYLHHSVIQCYPLQRMNTYNRKAGQNMTGDWQQLTYIYDVEVILGTSTDCFLGCFDIVFQRAYRYFSIALKVILALSDRYKFFTNDWL